MVDELIAIASYLSLAVFALYAWDLLVSLAGFLPLPLPPTPDAPKKRDALKRIAEEFHDVEIVVPVHFNPHVRRQVYAALEGTQRVRLLEPLGYEPFVQLLARSYLVLTDSGGVQEEAPSLGTPVLVMRQTTERPEGVEAGVARLVGVETGGIVSHVTELMRDSDAYRDMVGKENPYGDGRAGIRIADILPEWYSAWGRHP